MPKNSSRLFSLDALRGVAAIGVVFNHWKHFGDLAGGQPLVVDRTSSPYYALFQPLYEYGWVAVDLFFCVSGFIFAYYYWDKVRDGVVGATEFALQRISRLYPLFLLTLLLAAALIWYNQIVLGYDLIYGNADARHFFLNLLMVSAWGAEVGPSFNGPSWSVSVEMLLYCLFFFFVRRFGKSETVVSGLVAAILFGIALQFGGSTHVGRGITSFFLGMLVVQLGTRSHRRISTGVLAMTPLVLWGLIFFEAYTGRIAEMLEAALLPVLRSAELPEAVKVLKRVLLVFVAFPLTILCLVLLESRRKLQWAARLAWLGDLSYPVYLLHVPMQMMVISAERSGIIEFDEQRPGSLAAFLGVLLLVSMGSVRWFERPVQRLIRNGVRRSGLRART